MKLEPEKYYKCRNGIKAYVATIGNPLAINITYSAIGWIADLSYVREWNPDNGENADNGRLDIISEWREPIKVQAWVNVYPGNVICLSHTKEEANRAASEERVTCVYVSGEEGKEPGK